MWFVPYVTFTANATIPLLIRLRYISGFAILKYVVINIPVHTPLYILIFLFLDDRVLKVEILPNLWIVKLLSVSIIDSDLIHFCNNNGHNGSEYLLNIYLPTLALFANNFVSISFNTHHHPWDRYYLHFPDVEAKILWSTKQIWVLSQEIRGEVTMEIAGGDDTCRVM